jgi:pyruvate dehydrogenase E2 component (dihydrolipoamide acetyltransferase)
MINVLGAGEMGMASEIKLPELGEKVESGEIVDVKVAAGDEVSEGQALVEVEAEKSTVDVPSPIAGRVTQILVKKGDKVKTGQTLCFVEAKNGKQEGPKTAAPAREMGESKPEAKPYRPPDRKAESPAPAAALPAEKALPDQRGRDGVKTAPAPAEKTQEQLVPAGPATRRLARELGIDLALVHGTAPGGRVTQEDVKAYVRQLAAAPDGRGAGRAIPPLPDFERWGPVERIPLEPLRRRTAAQMSLSWSLVPHVTQHDQADITELEAFRKQQEGKGPKITITAFALKAAAIALAQFPHFNTSLDEAAGQLVFKKYFHIGVAVDTERGLLVPVLRDVDRKSVHALATELAEVAERARQKKIQADDMRGGTFTITNLGGIGGTGFTPIVNYPEVAILGLSRSRWQPVVQDGQVVSRLVLPLSLSYDHRVIDGAAAARFTRRLADMLEKPLEMLLHA